MELLDIKTLDAENPQVRNPQGLSTILSEIIEDEMHCKRKRADLSISYADLQERCRWVQRNSDDGTARWLIMIDEEAVGYVVLQRCGTTAEVGSYILSNFRRKGYASQAVQQIMAEQAIHYPDGFYAVAANAESAELLAKIGFKLTTRDLCSSRGMNAVKYTPHATRPVDERILIVDEQTYCCDA